MDTNSKEYRKEYQLACEIVKMMKHVTKKELLKAHKEEEQRQIELAAGEQSWFDLLRGGV